jgi:hypothetical protein
MLRTIVGTVALLAGFVVLEQTVDARTGLAGSCKATEAYALLQPGESLAVHATPTTEGTVIGVLAARPAGAEATRSVVTLIGSQSGWARIALADSDFTAAEGDKRQTGWIPADMLTVDTRVDGSVTLHTRPGLMGQEIGKIEGQDSRFRVLGCRGDWLQVINAQHGNVWIDRWCAREEGCRG